MAVTAQGTGTKTVGAVGTAETLLDVAIAGTFTLHVDKINMVAGDALELLIYQIVLTGGTRRIAYCQQYYGAQPTRDLIAVSVPISNELTDAGSLRFELNQLTGTARAFPWKVLKYA